MAMPMSSKARRFMQIWTMIAGLMFFAQCAMQAQPYLKVIMAKKPHAATQAAPSSRAQ
jgi:hypothetical protein